MLIIRVNYLLLVIYFLTQVAVLAAPLPSDSGPHNAVSMQMHSGPQASKTKKKKLRRSPAHPYRTLTIKSCGPCRTAKKKCGNSRPCKRCMSLGLTSVCVDWKNENGPDGVSLSLWHPLFSIATRGMT